MTPAQVIVASTRNAAEMIGLKDAGTIETGKSADFVVLDANPLDDITNTRRISSVYLRGRLSIARRWRRSGCPASEASPETGRGGAETRRFLARYRTILLVPARSVGLLKFNKSPTRNPVMRRYVSTCAQ